MEYIVVARRDGKPRGYVNVGRLFGCPFLDFGQKENAMKFKTKKDAADLVKICNKQGIEAEIVPYEEVKK